MPYASATSKKHTRTSASRKHRGKKGEPDIVCFSHLRWDFVFQRPQHLLTRAARDRRVFHVEEPIQSPGQARLELPQPESGVQRVIPRLPTRLTPEEQHSVLRDLISDYLAGAKVTDFISWYYTPMALPFSRHLRPKAIVYDCMDELSNFSGAAPEMQKLEAELFRLADVVFTGGYSLFRAKRGQHRNIHVFPSSIDADHFGRAHRALTEPADQEAVRGPKIGYCGVIDERMDVQLLQQVAKLRPDWQFIIIGPVVKIDPDTLPQRENIHYLGSKKYEDLPSYMSGWDVAIMPFALNAATRFISPTKTLEYLAAGLPVVSTAIADVQQPYGDLGLVGIAHDAEQFVQQCTAMERTARSSEWQLAVGSVLAATDWDRTWQQMNEQVAACLARPARHPAVQSNV